MGAERVATLIAQLGSRAFFTGGVSEERIRQVEELLGVRLPESYKWFLREYGYAAVGGLEILGVGKSKDRPRVVDTTCGYRKVGLPKPYVVVSDCDEWLYCLQTDRMAGGECPVTLWDPHGNEGVDTYPDFLAYLIAQCEEALTRGG
jgi:hypothetical protein